jgi:uncharacterized protein (TIGR00290 family)
MESSERVLVAWSGGKDSALALYEARTVSKLEVGWLLTTFNMAYDRVNMHGVRRDLVEKQAAALGVTVEKMWVVERPPGLAAGWSSYPVPPRPDAGFTVFPSNEDYERELRSCLRRFHAEGVRRVIFGDIFLEDLKAYRDRLLAEEGFSGIYPLWKRDSRKVMEEFLALGFQAIAVCVDTKRLDTSFAGRTVDAAFLADLPAGVDPAGENGEFHTFVFDGPGFARPVEFERGRRAQQGDFWFCDLLPKGAILSPPA